MVLMQKKFHSSFLMFLPGAYYSVRMYFWEQMRISVLSWYFIDFLSTASKAKTRRRISNSLPPYSIPNYGTICPCLIHRSCSVIKMFYYTVVVFFNAFFYPVFKLARCKDLMSMVFIFYVDHRTAVLFDRGWNQ